MSVLQFTPGPWEISGRKPVSRRVFMPDDCIEIVGPENGMVACLYAVNASMDGKRDRANARLISAAPELLAALEEARFVLEGFGADPIIKQIDEALTKARGEGA